MNISRSFLMVTTIAVVGFAAGSAYAQPMTLTPATPAPPAQPVPAEPPVPTPPGMPDAPRAAPAAPAEVDPRLSYRPGDVPLRRLLLGGMMPGEAMEAVDTDGDGKISAAEFQAAAEAFFTQLDTNGDGVLDDADRREPAVVEGGDRRPEADRGEVERRMQQFRGGMMGPNGMMFFGPMFQGMPGMWFYAVPVFPGGPDFRGGPNFEFRMPGPGEGGGRMWEERPGPDAGPGGGWYYWDQPERRRD
jgi:hypothetical protein